MLKLIQTAGYTSFRDARGPLGLTQRQAGGNFTRDEAAALLVKLRAGDDSSDTVAMDARPTAIVSGAEKALRKMPAEHLAKELDRRGWIVIAP